MTEPTTLPLRLVDALQELSVVPGIAPEIHAPRPALAASVDAVLERLATWSTDFAAGSAPATVKAVRSDWTQYLAWCEVFCADKPLRSTQNHCANGSDRVPGRECV